MKNKYVNAHNVVQIKEKMNARETRPEREAVYFIRMIHKMEKQMSFQLKKPFSKFACPKVYAAFSTLDAGIAQTSSFFYPYIIMETKPLLLQYRKNENMTTSQKLFTCSSSCRDLW